MPKNTAAGSAASPSPKKPALNQAVIIISAIVLAIVICAWLFSSFRAQKTYEDRIASERMLLNAESLSDPEEQSAAYQSLITAHGSSSDARISRTVALAMLGRASLMDAGTEQTRLVDSAINRLDQPGGTREDEANLCHALAMRAEVESRPAEKIALFDRMISRFGDAIESEIQGQVARAMWEKSELVADLPEKIRLLDEVVRRYENFPSTNVRWEVAKAMNLKGDAGTDAAARNAAYDQVIARFGGDRNSFIQGQVVWALLRKAEIATTDPEKLVIYDQLINDYGSSRDEYIRSGVEQAKTEKEKLMRE